MATNLYGTPASLKDELVEALNAMHSLGVPWRGTRFHDYLKTLEAEVERESRVIVPGKASRELMSRLWETVSQSRQLVHTRRIWGNLDIDALRRKLEIVVKGRALQPHGSEPDASRNALLELVTAWLLHETGFSIGITEDGADVTASISGLPPFAVECKRPSGQKTLKKNFTAVRRQLARRYADGAFEHGIAVIGIDRVLDLSANPPGRQSFLMVQQDVHETLRSASSQLQQMAPEVGFSPADTPIGGVVVVGAAFTLQPFGISTMEHLGFFNLAPLSDLRVAALSAMKRV